MQYWKFSKCNKNVTLISKVSNLSRNDFFKVSLLPFKNDKEILLPTPTSLPFFNTAMQRVSWTSFTKMVHIDLEKLKQRSAHHKTQTGNYIFLHWYKNQYFTLNIPVLISWPLFSDKQIASDISWACCKSGLKSCKNGLKILSALCGVWSGHWAAFTIFATVFQPHPLFSNNPFPFSPSFSNHRNMQLLNTCRNQVSCIHCFCLTPLAFSWLNIVAK